MYGETVATGGTHCRIEIYYVTSTVTGTWATPHPLNLPPPDWGYSRRRRVYPSDSGRWMRMTAHSYPPARLEHAALPEREPIVISLRPLRPWMLRLHGGPHERSARRRKRRTWEMAA
jgi:hypothetical protein